MTTLNTLAALAAERYPDVPSVAVRPGDDPAIILVGKGPTVPAAGRSIPGVHVTATSEDIVLDLVLAGSPIPARVLAGAVPLRDGTGVLSAAARHAAGIRAARIPGRPLAPAETAVRFEDCGDPAEFVRETLVPFMELTSGTTGGRPFSLRSDYSLATLNAVVTFHSLRPGKTPTDLRRAVLEGLPEFAAHRISVTEGPKPRPDVPAFVIMETAAFRKEEAIAASAFVRLLSDGEADEAAPRRTLADLYIRTGKARYGTPQEFWKANREVLDWSLRRATSGISRAILEEKPLAAAAARIRASYAKMLAESVEETAPALLRLAQGWETAPALLRLAQGRESAREDEEGHPGTLDNAWCILFLASLQHPFTWGYVPYCIDALLPGTLGFDA